MATSADVLRERVRQRLADQRSVVQGLLRLREQLQGSVFVRYGRCGKETCTCATPQGAHHGPYTVLSARGPAGSTFAYLDAERLREAKELLERHRAFRRGLQDLQKLNGDIVGLLRRYQKAMAQKGRGRLGLVGVRKKSSNNG